ncbi:MAG: response regulator transcription factor [Anaerolineales bacterium]|nr:response regulator transcription factor [Anaerolineales bacterium]
MSVRILLVDDHPLVREGVRRILERQPEFRVVEEIGEGLQVVPLVQQFKPDVVILDLSLPGLGGIEITRQIKGLALGTRVIILSRYTNESYVAAALDAGAVGYVNKQSVPQELIQAVSAALSGVRYLSPSISREVLNDYQESAHRRSSSPYKILTPRERQVLHMVTEGLTNQQIATSLGISVRTIEVHRSNLLHKLGVQSTAELVRYSIERGILAPE